MTQNFRPYNPNQLYLMPPSIREWVPEGDLSHFISDTVDTLDLRVFKKRYRDDGGGTTPYHPGMMLKILVYSYSIGLFSSRKIAQGLKRDVALRMLCAENYPNFRTINRFRLDNLEAFEQLFVEVVRLAREVGLVKLGTVAIDGSKVNANASKRKAMSYGRMKEEEKRLKKEIKELMRRAQEVDEAEDAQYGEGFRGDEIPEELKRREDRLTKIREAKARLEARQREEDEESGRSEDDHKPENRGGRVGPNFKREFGIPDDKKQDNFTDPESRIMKTSTSGFQQSYNAQIAVDEAAHIIVAVDVGDIAADNGCLIPMIDEVKKNTGANPANVLADSGYKSEDNFKKLNQKKVTGYVSLGREGSDRKVTIGPKQKHTKAMKRRLHSKRGKTKYRKRKGIAEAPFGWVKQVLGFRQFSLRGLQKVKAEWSLVCLAVNLRRMHTKVN
jgi:transposase